MNLIPKCAEFIRGGEYATLGGYEDKNQRYKFQEQCFE